MHHDIETSLKYANMVFTLVELSEIRGRRNRMSNLFYNPFPLCMVPQGTLSDSENSEFGAAVVLGGFFFSPVYKD